MPIATTRVMKKILTVVGIVIDCLNSFTIFYCFFSELVRLPICLRTGDRFPEEEGLCSTCFEAYWYISNYRPRSEANAVCGQW